MIKFYGCENKRKKTSNKATSQLQSYGVVPESIENTHPTRSKCCWKKVCVFEHICLNRRNVERDGIRDTCFFGLQCIYALFFLPFFNTLQMNALFFFDLHAATSICFISIATFSFILLYCLSQMLNEINRRHCAFARLATPIHIYSYARTHCKHIHNGNYEPTFFNALIYFTLRVFVFVR